MPHRNRLTHETSPYLLQHADNPVDWHPWDDEALRLAQQQNKPILLSIGYSACHWCHVMAHESFEDEETAALMNHLFVNIKVDREERPDLDKIYQLAHAVMMRRSGGWPLTMFLTPDQVPFFGSTYFPKEARYGLPAFKDVLPHIAAYLKTKPDDIRRQNDSMQDFFKSLNAEPPATDIQACTTLPMQAMHDLIQDFDSHHGGFGAAPKFPHSSSLELALRYGAATLAGTNHSDAHAQAIHIASFSLEQMAKGGLYDQIGGGFYRYSVDERWEIPHFEKMLYDNAQLLTTYVQAHQICNIELFKRVTEETADWVIREMQASQGGYFSTLDADSDGEEGLFYTWTQGELEKALSAEEYKTAASCFGINKPANFEGRWHLNLMQETATVGSNTAVQLRAIKQKLFATREQRIRPGRDEKILTSWNGLMIRAMALAGRHLKREDYIRSAQQSLDFIRKHLYSEGRLLATCKDNQAKYTGYLDDYAFLLNGILELLQSQWRNNDLEFAIRLADTLLDHFQDGENGGFYFTADDHETLIHRPKSSADDATPAGNASAAYALNCLGHLLGVTRYLKAAERAILWALPGIQQSPLGHCSFLNTLETWLKPPEIIIVRCPATVIDTWRQQTAHIYAPQRMVFYIDSALPPTQPELANFKPVAEISAYICRGTECLPVITDPEIIRRTLQNTLLCQS